MIIHTYINMDYIWIIYGLLLDYIWIIGDIMKTSWQHREKMMVDWI